MSFQKTFLFTIHLIALLPLSFASEQNFEASEQKRKNERAIKRSFAYESSENPKASKIANIRTETSYESAIKSFNEAFYLIEKQQYRESFLALENASQLGHSLAFYSLGLSHFRGQGTHRNYSKAFECFQNPQIADLPENLFMLGLCYKVGLGTPQNEPLAFESFLKGANQNNTKCCYEVACCFLDGIGTETNEKKALEYFIKAAEGGHVESCYEVACHYIEGLGSHEGGFKKFLTLLETKNKSEEIPLESPESQKTNDISLKERHKTGFYWLLKAGENGHTDAYYDLMCCYKIGIGIEQNEQEENKWKEKLLMLYRQNQDKKTP